MTVMRQGELRDITAERGDPSDRLNLSEEGSLPTRRTSCRIETDRPTKQLLETTRVTQKMAAMAPSSS